MKEQKLFSLCNYFIDEFLQEVSLSQRMAFINCVFLVLHGERFYKTPLSMREKLFSNFLKVDLAEFSADDWDFESVTRFASLICLQPLRSISPEIRASIVAPNIEVDTVEDIEEIYGAIANDDKGWGFAGNHVLNDGLYTCLISIVEKKLGTANFCHAKVDDYHICGKVLSPQAKGNYCVKHRHLKPKRRKYNTNYVRRKRNKSSGLTLD